MYQYQISISIIDKERTLTGFYSFTRDSNRPFPRSQRLDVGQRHIGELTLAMPRHTDSNGRTDQHRRCKNKIVSFSWLWNCDVFLCVVKKEKKDRMSNVLWILTRIIPRTVCGSAGGRVPTISDCRRENLSGRSDYPDPPGKCGATFDFPISGSSKEYRFSDR